MLDPKKLEAAAREYTDELGWRAIPDTDIFITGARYAEAELRGEIEELKAMIRLAELIIKAERKSDE